MSDFPKCCTFVRLLYERFNHPRIFDHVHGRLHYRPFMDNVHGRRYYRPWETSSVYKPYSSSRTFLSLLGWFLIPSTLLDMDNPYERIRDELISHYPINTHSCQIQTHINNVRVNNFYFNELSFYFIFLFLFYFFIWDSSLSLTY